MNLHTVDIDLVKMKVGNYLMLISRLNVTSLCFLSHLELCLIKL